MDKLDYDRFLTEIYDYSPYFGKERREKNFASPFYLNALEKVEGRVLEFVSCTGLLTIPLARAGHEIDSIDISPFMHDYLKSKLQNETGSVHKNINLISCDVFEYRSITKYNAIVLPDSFLLAISNKEKQIDLLKHCNSLLNAGGILVFDVFQPWADIIKSKEKSQCSRFRLNDGKLYIVYTNHSIDEEQQLHHFDFTHESVRESKSCQQHMITYRYLYKKDIVSILNKCGFDLVWFDDSFNFNKYYAVVARKTKDNIK